MIVTVSGRHMEITPAIRTHAEAKANKLTRYYDLIHQIEVIVDGSKDKSHSVEFVVNADHNGTFVASCAGEDVYAAIDQVCHKLERQLTDHKEKFRNRKHPTQ
jgi:putative sigma-54 modulation protein